MSFVDYRISLRKDEGERVVRPELIQPGGNAFPSYLSYNNSYREGKSILFFLAKSIACW